MAWTGLNLKALKIEKKLEILNCKNFKKLNHGVK
jgi:hypothetical protein